MCTSITLAERQRPSSACGPAAIMLSVEAYERGEHERPLLRLLARGEKEIRAGRGDDLSEVLDEADALLVRAWK